jgi:hypothetical protein
MGTMKGTAYRLGTSLLMLAMTTAPVAAQTNAAGVPDSAASVPDSAEPGKKKGGGLLGKAKKLAGNKAVRQVAKTMACTMVPGGQVVAGAIDAASSESVGEAAAGAAGAEGGQTCMPGGMGMGAAATGAAGMPGLAGAGELGGAGEAAGLAGMPGGFDTDAVAACMGLTPGEFLLLTNEPTKEEADAQRQVAAKVEPERYQACVMQQLGTRTGGPGAGMLPESAPDEDDAPADGKLSEASGRAVELPDDVKAHLKKGRAVVRDIDWLTGGGNVVEAGLSNFTEAMATLAEGMSEAGGTWRADIYVDKRYGDEAAAAIGSARLATVVSALEAGGLGKGAVAAGRTKKDKRPRLEIVRTGK